MVDPPTDSSPPGLHLQLIEAGATFRFALWFEEYPDPRAHWMSLGGSRAEARLHPGCPETEEPPEWLPDGLHRCTFNVHLKSLSNGFPIPLPGPMSSWAIRSFKSTGRVINEGLYQVSGWMLPPAMSLGPLRRFLLDWRTRLGEGFLTPAAIACVPVLDEVLAILRDRPLLPVLAPRDDVWKLPEAMVEERWPDADQPLALVPPMSLDELDHLADRLFGIPTLAIAARPRYPGRLARFVVELFQGARAVPPVLSAEGPWTKERLHQGLLLSDAALVELHRDQGSCLYPGHPVWKPPVVPQGHLHGTINPGGAASPEGRPLMLDLGLVEEEKHLSLKALVAHHSTSKPIVEHEGHVFFRPTAVLFRDWSAMAAQDPALFARPEIFAEGKVSISEEEAQRLLEKGPDVGDRASQRAFFDREGIDPRAKPPKKFTRFTVTAGHTAAIHVRLRLDLVGDPDEQSKGLGNVRFAPRIALAISDQDLALDEADRILASTKSSILQTHGLVMHRASLEDALLLARAREKVLSKLSTKDGGGGLRWTSIVEIEDQFAEEIDEGACELVFAEQWKTFMEKIEGGEGLRLLGPPEGFLGSLRPYQARGLSWLCFLLDHGLGACLADDMGLGKTVQVVAMLCERKARRTEGDVIRPSLVVCPTSVVTNWAREAEKFAPGLRVYMHQGPERAINTDAFAERTGASDVTVTSFALVRRDHDLLHGRPWDVVIVDEAQNIKNPDAQQARVIKGLDAQGRVALTGTPVENRLRDLWSIVHFLDPGLLGGPTRFARAFATPIRAGNESAFGRLRKRLAPFLLRRTKRDPEIAKDLPEKQEQDVYCQLTREQVALYRAMSEAALSGLEDKTGLMRKAHILTALLRLKQICNHPESFVSEHPEKLFERSGKLDRLGELLEELLEERQPALIFTQFSEMGAILERAIEEQFGVEAPLFHGGLTAVAREKMVQDFQSEDGPPILILSLRAGGTGINLTRASAVIHYDRWWNPAVEDQATDRAHRIGQRAKVNVYKFVTQGTIEERIEHVLLDKRDLSNKVLAHADDGWITELDNAELRDMFSLGDIAVDDAGNGDATDNASVPPPGA